MLTPANIDVVKITTKTRLERKMVRALSEFGAIELIDVEQKGSSGSSTGTPDSNYENDVLSLLSNISSAIDTLKIDTNKVMVIQKRQYDETEIKTLLSELSEKSSSIIEEVDKLRTMMNTVNSEITEYRNIEETARRLIPLGIDFDLLREGTHFYLACGLVKQSNTSRLDWNVKEITNDQYFISKASYNKNDDVIVVGVLKKYEADLVRILTSFGFSEFEIPENIKGNPKDVLRQILYTLAEKQKELAELEAKRNQLALKYQDDLVSIYEQLNIEKDRFDARAKFRRTTYAVELWGFVPRKQVRNIEAMVLSIDPDALISVEDPHFDKQDYPTLLENNKIVKPFESLVYSFGAPTYHHDWDPTLLMAFTFPLFFGLMFGDVAHGFLVLLLGLLGFKYDPHQGGLRGLLAQARAFLVSFGIFAMFFGFMFGSFLGLEGEYSPIPALWFNPGSQEPIAQFGGATGQFALLQLTFIVGNLHILLGLTLMAIGMFKHKEYVKMIFFPVLLIIGYILALILVFSYSLDLQNWFFPSPDKMVGSFDIAIVPILGYGDNALIKIPNPTLISYPMILIFVIFTLYLIKTAGMDGMSEAIDFLLTLLSNSVSYARLFAVFIVHGILARLFVALFGIEEIVFHHGEVTSVIGGLIPLLESVPHIIDVFVDLPLIISLLLGAAVIMSLELLITSIQAIRLHWVEWFSKMHYHGSGRQFKPFKSERRFTMPAKIEGLSIVPV
ncbi:MAG: V-type ATP synthase subunit I [Candidatus Thorarchaeota archaeon]